MQDITVEQIAEEAEVSRRTFFNHFATKNDAFIPDFAAAPERALEDFASGVTPDFLEAVEQLLLARVRLLDSILDSKGFAVSVIHDNPELHPLLIAQVRSFELAVRQAAATRFRCDVEDPRALTTANLVTSLERSALEMWRETWEGTPPEALVHRSLDGLRAALSA